MRYIEFILSKINTSAYTSASFFLVFVMFVAHSGKILEAGVSPTEAILICIASISLSLFFFLNAMFNNELVEDMKNYFIRHTEMDDR